MILLIVVVIALAGGGLYAAGDGLLGAVLNADALKLKAAALAKVDAIEADAKAEEKSIVAKIKAELAKL